MAKNTEAKIKPLKITLENGETYILEFSRESIKFAEQRGFNITSYKNQIETGVSDLFFYAFRKNHRDMARNKTDAILADMEGLLPEEMARLEDLYISAVEAFNMNGERKNARVTVEL